MRAAQSKLDETIHAKNKLISENNEVINTLLYIFMNVSSTFPFNSSLFLSVQLDVFNSFELYLFDMSAEAIY